MNRKKIFQLRNCLNFSRKDFLFELTKNKWIEPVTICDRLPENIKHSSVSPFAFTEHGVTMLSSMLRSEIAVNISIKIVRAFAEPKSVILTRYAEQKDVF